MISSVEEKLDGADCGATRRDGRRATATPTGELTVRALRPAVPRRAGFLPQGTVICIVYIHGQADAGRRGTVPARRGTRAPRAGAPTSSSTTCSVRGASAARLPPYASESHLSRLASVGPGSRSTGLMTKRLSSIPVSSGLLTARIDFFP